MDSVVEIYDSNLNLVALNDQNGLAPGLCPQNDSFTQAALPADGTYYVVVSDYYNQGGTAYTYRLHVRLP